MNWLDIALVGAVVIGAACGTALVVRSPDFWVGIAISAWKAALPVLVKFISKRMTPEEEAEWHKAIRRGQGDEWLRKRQGSLKD